MTIILPGRAISGLDGATVRTEWLGLVRNDSCSPEADRDPDGDAAEPPAARRSPRRPDGAPGAVTA